MEPKTLFFRGLDTDQDWFDSKITTKQKRGAFHALKNSLQK